MKSSKLLFLWATTMTIFLMVASPPPTEVTLDLITLLTTTASAFASAFALPAAPSLDISMFWPGALGYLTLIGIFRAVRLLKVPWGKSEFTPVY